MLKRKVNIYQNLSFLLHSFHTKTIFLSLSLNLCYTFLILSYLYKLLIQENAKVKLTLNISIQSLNIRTKSTNSKISWKIYYKNLCTIHYS